MKLVSIRAPAWGAMSTAWRRRREKTFQFARPHGARFTASRSAARKSCFNSRARMGRDINSDKIREVKTKFQFARPHGARSIRALWWDSLKVSIRAPAWGAIRSRALKGCVD